MTFQFLCPQGHLLQGEEAHMGMQCQCPQCGTAFIIPTVERSAPAEPAPASTAPSSAPDLGPPDSTEPDLGGGLEGFGSDLSGEFDTGDLGSAVDETLLHIPCPNGHELEVPLDMLNQRAMCPHCGAEFRLRREKSIEHIFQQEALDRRRGEFWFKMAIVASAVVIVLLVIMIAAIALT
ncbi:MAG: hypothetical protein DWQ37_04620 [Planctomycetota bacterium]|nr:MAG: hypothetical protein DWQ37_04620 [Planctomycetota bacterium]